VKNEELRVKNEELRSTLPASPRGGEEEEKIKNEELREKDLYCRIWEKK